MAYGRKRKTTNNRRSNGRPTRRRISRTNRVPRGITPAVYRFKRDIEETISFSESTPEGWNTSGNAIYRQFGWSLGALGNSADFTNLFAQYRIKGARVKMFFSTTVSGQTGDGAQFVQQSAMTNAQLIVRMAPNQSGQVTTLDLPFWAQAQAKRYKTCINGGRPLDLFMRLKQANEVTSSTGTATTMMTPKFISTAANNVQHYGMNISFERADGQPFGDFARNTQYCKLITTLYLECRRVQ